MTIELKRSLELNIRDEADGKHLILVSQDRLDQVTEGITCLNWQSCLARLWNHSY